MQNTILNNEKSDSLAEGRNEGASGNAGSVALRAVDRRLEGRRTAYAAEIERLIEAGFKVIRDTGSLEPRVSEILAVAGLSNQAFYKHFRSKDELLVAILDEGVQRLRGYLEHQMSAAHDPLAAIRAWLRGVVAQALDTEAAEATRPFALSRARLGKRFPSEVEASEGALTQILEAALSDAKSSGQLPNVDPRRDAEMLYDLAMAWVQRRLLADRGDQPHEAEAMVAFALRGLGADASDSEISHTSSQNEDSHLGT